MGDENLRIEQLRKEANETTNASLESTRRMKALALETQDVGNTTLQNLDTQGEQLNRIEGGLDNVNTNVEGAEKELKSIEKCCGCFVCPWNRSKKYEPHNSYQKTKGKKGKGGKKSNEEDGRNPTTTRNTGNTSQEPNEPVRMKRITNDAREDEMEENLNDIGSIVGNLKTQANEMGETLENQNVQLERIDNKLNSNVERIDAANKRTENILN